MCKILKNKKSELVRELNKNGRGGDFFKEGIRLAKQWNIEGFKESCDLYSFENGDLYIIKSFTKNNGNKLRYRVSGIDGYSIEGVSLSKYVIEEITKNLVNYDDIDDAIDYIKNGLK